MSNYGGPGYGHIVSPNESGPWRRMHDDYSATPLEAFQELVDTAHHSRSGSAHAVSIGYSTTPYLGQIHLGQVKAFFALSELGADYELQPKYATVKLPTKPSYNENFLLTTLCGVDFFHTPEKRAESLSNRELRIDSFVVSLALIDGVWSADSPPSQVALACLQRDSSKIGEACESLKTEEGHFADFARAITHSLSTTHHLFSNNDGPTPTTRTAEKGQGTHRGNPLT